jgi:hypothetical protein
VSWNSFATWVQSIPLPVQWALALTGVAIGLAFILWPQRVTAALRRWLLVQLQWVRRPGYRRMLKLYGWLLFVTGCLLMSLLVIQPAGR